MPDRKKKKKVSTLAKIGFATAPVSSAARRRLDAGVARIRDAVRGRRPAARRAQPDPLSEGGAMRNARQARQSVERELGLTRAGRARRRR